MANLLRHVLNHTKRRKGIPRESKFHAFGITQNKCNTYVGNLEAIPEKSMTREAQRGYRKSICRPLTDLQLSGIR
jgi:hypothetical protein